MPGINQVQSLTLILTNVDKIGTDTVILIVSVVLNEGQTLFPIAIA